MVSFKGFSRLDNFQLIRSDCFCLLLLQFAHYLSSCGGSAPLTSLPSEGYYANKTRKTGGNLDIKKTAIIFNGFLHDFAAGIWLAAIVTIVWLHGAHLAAPATAGILNLLERRLFWSSVAAAVIIMATGAGRTFTYVDNWYGEDAEHARRRALIAKHLILFIAYGLGYFWVWGKVFH